MARFARILVVVAAMVSVQPAHAAEAPPLPIPWLTVAHPAGQRAVIVDDHNRTVILHGVNMVGVEDDFYRTPSGDEPGPTPMFPIDPAAYDGKCPAMSHYAGEAPVCEVDGTKPFWQHSAARDSHDDFAQARALGFNFVRLGVSWSQLEPRLGVYSRAYLNRIAQVVGWAHNQGIHVLLDMHQDNYSRYTPQTAAVSAPPLLIPTQESSAHADGAPPWAVLTDGEPALAPRGIAELNLYTNAAWTSFWLNRKPPESSTGLQDHYIAAMEFLAKRFTNEPAVAGYDLMNEPLPGAIPLVAFTTTTLHPFYKRIVDALTQAGVTRQLFFFEPAAIRNVTSAPDYLPLRWTSDPRLVYSPHVYTHVFTADALLGIPNSPYPLSYDQPYQVADAEARSMNAALVVGEYGDHAGADETYLRDETAAEERSLAGSALYAWKGPCGANAMPAECADGWSVYAGDPSPAPAQNGPLIPSRVKFLSRTYPMATAGRLDSYSYDPDTHAFRLSATATAAWGRTEIFVPAGALGNVTVAGQARLESSSGDRVWIVTNGTGPYQVEIG